MFEGVLKKHEFMITVNEIITEEGWKFAFLIRLNPLVPMELFNYAVALTDISPMHNAIASLGSMFIVCFEVYGAASAAAIASTAAKAHSGHADGENAGEKIKEILYKLAASAVLMGFVAMYGKRKYDDKVLAKQAKDASTPSTPERTVSRVSTPADIAAAHVATATMPALLVQSFRANDFTGPTTPNPLAGSSSFETK